MGHPGVCGWLRRGHSRDLRCQVGLSLAFRKAVTAFLRVVLLGRGLR